MSEIWTKTFDTFQESYTPGETLPPVKNEWRYRSQKTYYKVVITGVGDHCKKYVPMKSDLRPVIKGNSVGIAMNAYGDNPCWAFFTFSELTIEKYVVNTLYRLVSDDDDGVIVEYTDSEPVMVAEDGDW